MSADCKHHSIRSHGQLVCKLCGWVWRIGLAGSRWVNPKETPVDG